MAYSSSRLAGNGSIARSMTKLGDYTTARVGLGITGESLPTERAAGFSPGPCARPRRRSFSPGLRHTHSRTTAPSIDPIPLHSAAANRDEYLRRPDKGRRLNDASAQIVAAHHHPTALILADGLSALAVHRHAIPLLKEISPTLNSPSGSSNRAASPSATTSANSSKPNYPSSSSANALASARQTASVLYLTWHPPHRPHRRRAQLHLQHPRPGPPICRSRPQARIPNK